MKCIVKRCSYQGISKLRGGGGGGGGGGGSGSKVKRERDPWFC